MVNQPPSEPRFAGVPVPTPPIADDDGTAAVELTASLDAFAAGGIGAHRVLEALAGSRLLVPVVAVLDESEVGADGLRHEKHSSMATILVQRPDGGRALLGFSSIDALTRWREEARPVPLAAPLAARAAVDEGADTLLIDVAGPVPFAVSDAELLLVAAVSRSPGDPCDDPVLIAALRRLIRTEPRVLSATLRAAPGDPGASGAGAPALLTLGIDTLGTETLGTETEDPQWLGQFVQRVASDPVVARLLPEGLRVKGTSATDTSDTPGIVLLSDQVI